MTIDASAVARGTGIETRYENGRQGGIEYLPQRVAVIAQGGSSTSYSTDPYLAPDAVSVGNRFEFGSPAHLIADALLPQDPDQGLGTVPVTIYPVQDNGSGVAATGSITPTGTQSKAAEYYVEIAKIRSERFVLPLNASVSTICGIIGQAIAAVLKMPVRVTYAYGTVTSAPKSGGNVGNGTLTAFTTTAKPVPGNYRLTCVTAATHGGVFSLYDANGRVVASGLTMTGGTGAATPLVGAGLGFTLTDGTTDFAVGDAFDIVIPATAVNLTAKWKGTSANGYKIALVGDSLGVTYVLAHLSGGLANPALDAALAAIGPTWETMVINALEIADTTALDAIQAYGEPRWGELQRKPFVAYTGVTLDTVELATAVCSARRTDRVNAQLVSPGALDIPFLVAARQVAKIARLANNNPPTDYGSQEATGLVPGAGAVQWDYLKRDQAVKLGSSTVEIKNGVVCVADVVTFYRPVGEQYPAYRHVVDIVKLQNVLYNIDARFNVPAWDGAPLIPDNQPTTNPRARKPRFAVREAASMVEALGLEAILSDPEASKKAIVASIDSQNSKRLNVEIPVKVSGNANIKSIVLRWSFFYGSSSVVG